MATTTATNSFIQRLIGAAALDTAIYEEVEADRGATAQAMAVVLLSSLAAGIGAGGLYRIPTLIFVTTVSLIGWAAWALVTFEIGSRLMPTPDTRVDVGELLRTIGFATTPGLLQVFGVISGVTYPVFAIASIWTLVAMIVAVRQALDYTSTARAVAVCVLGWVLSLAIAITLGLVFGPAVS